MSANCSALIGQIFPEKPAQLIQEWLETKPEDRILQTLIDQGMSRLRREQTAFYLEMVKEWLSRSSFDHRRYGLWALYYLAIDPDYRNLPEIYYLLIPFLRSIPNELRPDILNILQNLAHHASRNSLLLNKTSIDLMLLISSGLPPADPRILNLSKKIYANPLIQLIDLKQRA
jgi:hypothetical protein